MPTATTTTDFAPVTLNGVALSTEELDRLDFEAEDVNGLRFLIGRTVRRTHPDGTSMIGVLESVYVTDGLAANVYWDSENFCLGPLYGDTIEEVEA